LDAIAAAVIGGTSLSGVKDPFWGRSSALLSSARWDGLRILSVPQEWQIVVTGTILVLAVYLIAVARDNPVMKGGTCA